MKLDWIFYSLKVSAIGCGIGAIALHSLTFNPVALLFCGAWTLEILASIRRGYTRKQQ